MLHIDVSEDVEYGLFQGKVELAISDSNAQAKPKRWRFPVLRGGWFKNYSGLAQKSKLEEKSEVSGEILLPCVYNLGQVHLLPHAVEW